MTEPVGDSRLCDMDIEVLRICNGEDIPGWTGGAAMNVCCSFLKNRGYLNFDWSINDKGRALLEALGY